jgi:branched-subunit amino acid aminotransferase/4-amino-4-deoxychorismate lyase
MSSEAHDIKQKPERFYLDGESVKREAFNISGLDIGLLRGVNAFETARTYNGRMFRPIGHARRLVQSAAALGIPCPTAEELTQEFEVAVLGLRYDAKVRATLTGGGRRLVHVAPLDPNYVQKPLSVVTREWEAPEWLGRVKHGSRAMNIATLRATGADEVFWIGQDGCYTEAARSSIFAVVRGVVVTPPDDGRILQGITRSGLLDAARLDGIPLEVRPLHHTEPIDELYATSTLKEMSAVIQLDNETGPGDGPVGVALLNAFHRLVHRETT